MAKVKTVRKFVRAASPDCGKVWMDKAVDPTVRLLAFRFNTRQEADKIARAVRSKFGVAVKRTTAPGEFGRMHSEYVRVRAVL